MVLSRGCKVLELGDDIKTRLFSLTLVSQLILSILNGLLFLFLARHFGPQTFNDYMAVVSICSGLAISTKGIQAVTALEYSSSGEITTRQSVGDLHALLFGFSLFGFWVAATPIIAHLLNASFFTTLGGGFILIGASMGSRASGKFQGLSLFESSQISIAIVSILQIPIVLIALLFHAPLSIVIGLLSVPSLIMYFYSYVRFRDFRPAFIASRGSQIFLSSAQATIIALLVQFPILFLKRHFSSEEIGLLTGLIFTFSVGVTISSVLGSFLLPKFISTQTVSNFQSLKPHFVSSLPVIMISSFLLLGGTKMLAIIFGDGYSGDISTADLGVMAISYCVWAITSSLVQERLASTSYFSVWLQFFLLIGEAWIYVQLKMSNLDYFLVHGFVGLSTFFLVLGKFIAMRKS